MKDITAVCNQFVPEVRDELLKDHLSFLGACEDYRDHVVDGCGWVDPDYMTEEFENFTGYPTLNNLEIIILGIYMQEFIKIDYIG